MTKENIPKFTHEYLTPKHFEGWGVGQRMDMMLQLGVSQNPIMTKIVELFISERTKENKRSFFTTKEIALKVNELPANVHNALTYLEKFKVVGGRKLGKCIMWFITEEKPRKK